MECDKPDDLENGKAVFTSKNYKSTVKYECRYGYKLVGTATRSCGPDKTWEGEQPRCTEIDCGSPGVLPNGYLEGRRTTLGSVVWFKCFEGMVFSGSSKSTTCLENGTWSAELPACLAPCLVPDITNGRINNVAPGVTVPHGTIINATCKPQYELSYTASPSRCNNETWTHVPKCIPGKVFTISK